MYYYDSTFLLLIPAIILTIYAQAKIHSTYKRFEAIKNHRGLSGKEMAELMLQKSGLHDVPVKIAHGYLSDHYNPLKKELRLSDGVYHGTSISALGVAAHEAGHALQHSRHYFPLHIRTAMYPVVSFSSYLAPILIIFGFIIQSFNLLEIGIILYAASVFFTIVTLPVEFDASRRALAFLQTNSILNTQEMTGARKVLNAAALTYIAAAITAILELLRLILIARNHD